MLPNNTASDIIDLLGQRTEFLECLQNTSKDKRTLVEDLDCSRSTIDRGVRELESLGLLAYDTTGYETTSCGQLAAEEYRRLERRIELLLAFQPFLEWIPPDEIDFELDWLADAELLLPEAGDPYAMVYHHVERLRAADDIQLTLPLTAKHAHEAVYQNVVNGSARVEVIVQPAVAEVFRSSSAYAEQTAEMVATGRFTIFVYDGKFPYAVIILDDTVQIGVDEDGEPRALLETDSIAVRKWAQQKIEAYKQQSTKLDQEKKFQLEPTDD